MKHLHAIKVGGEWLVEIVRVITVTHQDDVFKIARQEGLEVDKHSLKANREKIYAE